MVVYLFHMEILYASCQLVSNLTKLLCAHVYLLKGIYNLFHYLLGILHALALAHNDPLPLSPALAASMDAFRLSKSVSAAFSLD